jgi:hypothetical protein
LCNGRGAEEDGRQNIKFVEDGELWNCGIVELWSCGVVQLWSCAVVELRSLWGQTAKIWGCGERIYEGFIYFANAQYRIWS